MLAATVGRKLFVPVNKQALWLNLYIGLVAQPGSGKSRVMDRAKEIIDRANSYQNGTHIRLGADSITKASLVEDIMEAKAEVGGMNQAMITMMEMTAFHDELASFMSKYDGEIISILLKLFDCPKHYKETRASLKEPRELHNVFFNWCFGTTPDFWSRVMVHEQETGMKSRIILCSEQVDLYGRDIFNSSDSENTSTGGQGEITNRGVVDTEQQEKLDILARELVHISTFERGWLSVSADAAGMLNAWWRAGAKPLPASLELGDYKARRDLYVLKFAGIKAASEGAREITTAQMRWAMETLFDFEGSVQYIYENLRESDHGRVMDDCYQFFGSRTIKPDGKVTQFSGQDLRKYLSTKLKVYEIENMVQQLVQSGYIILRSDSTQQGQHGMAVKVQRFVVNPNLRARQ